MVKQNKNKGNTDTDYTEINDIETGNIYCGNNRLNPDVVSGDKYIGDRYSCFKRGIGVGLNEDVDESYRDYLPISNRRYYCGTKKRKPRGYDLLGSNSDCLRKGVGVGKKLKYEREYGEDDGENEYRYNPKNTYGEYNSENNTDFTGKYMKKYIDSYKLSYKYKHISKSHFYKRFFTVFIVSFICFLIAIYTLKPDIIVDREYDKNMKLIKKINKVKMFLFVSVISIIVSFVYIWVV